MNYYKKLSSALHDVENLEEAWDIPALINESYQENKITKDEELSLQSDLLSYCGSLLVLALLVLMITIGRK
ncbi:hypothetical protein ACS4RT_13320 [Bacillus amyloliquefaciens]